MIIVVLVILKIISMVRSHYQCPNECRCTVTSNKYVTVCQELGLIDLPLEVNNLTNFLDLSGNTINNLKNDSFLLSGLINLESIAIDSSNVVVVEKNAFSGLRWLKDLDLSNNSITAIDPFLFSDNKLLEFVNFSGNPIHKLESYQFTALPKLTVLDFQNCALKSVENEAFSNLLFLETLSLKNNQLNTLPKGIFNWLRNLKNVELHGNPWKCDCNIQSIVIVLLLRRLYSNNLTCTYEISNEHLYWQEIKQDTDCTKHVENNVRENLISSSANLLTFHKFSFMNTTNMRKSSQINHHSSELLIIIIVIMIFVSVLFIISKIFIYNFCYKCHKNYYKKRASLPSSYLNVASTSYSNDNYFHDNDDSNDSISLSMDL